MTVKIFARPVSKVIASFSWDSLAKATLIEDDDGYLLTVEFDDVPAMLTSQKKVSRRISVDPNENKYILAAKMLSQMLSMMAKAKKYSR